MNTTDTSGTNIGEINPFLYRGYYYDSETGLYYLNSRYYDPQTGRFVSEDGQFNPDTGLAGNNLFAYCNNMPTNGADYNGTRFTEFDDGTGRWEEVDSVGVMHQGSGTKHLSAKSTTKANPSGNSVKNVAGNINTGLSVAGEGVKGILSQAEKFKPIYKADGAIYFERYLKNASAIKAVDKTSLVLTFGFAAWDLHNIWFNSKLTMQQKSMGTAIAGGSILAGVGVGYLAAAAANCWNPAGWGMIAAIGVVFVGSELVSIAEEQAYKKEGIDS